MEETIAPDNPMEEQAAPAERPVERHVNVPCSNPPAKQHKGDVSELVAEAFLAKAARSKEWRWKAMSGREQILFREAVTKQWAAWLENDAASVIAVNEANVIKKTLRKNGKLDRVLQSRFVFVDKNEGKSTKENTLPIKASARLVRPGYVDPDVLEIRRDAPTACRESISILLAIASSKGR